MRFVILAGSHRRGSQSLKVARFLGREIEARGEDVSLLDLAEAGLPLWDDDLAADVEPWATVWAPRAREIRASDAVVLVTPEWGGMVTPALKNALLLCTRGELSHKPALAVAVSSSDGGAYPIAELRMSSGKNTHLCFIPEHVIVRRVHEVLNDPEPQPGSDDARLRERIRYAVAVLIEYARALRGVHASGVLDEARFPWGM